MDQRGSIMLKTPRKSLKFLGYLNYTKFRYPSLIQCICKKDKIQILGLLVHLSTYITIFTLDTY